MKKKKILTAIGLLLGLLVAGILLVMALLPWMDRWGATDGEIAATYVGDELVPAPARVINHAITIHATPEQIYPWIVQLGAGRGGYYSYSWLEAMINCKIINADRIHSEWQDLKAGDEVKMCPGSFGPPPYKVASLGPLYSVVLGHQENGDWVEVWQFVIEPLPDGASRLIVRTRTMMTGGFWEVIRPGVFVMETGMMRGIKARAETMAGE